MAVARVAADGKDEEVEARKFEFVCIRCPSPLTGWSIRMSKISKLFRFFMFVGRFVAGRGRLWQGKALVAKAPTFETFSPCDCLLRICFTLASSVCDCVILWFLCLLEVKKDIKIPEGQPDLGFQWRPLGQTADLIILDFPASPP